MDLDEALWERERDRDREAERDADLKAERDADREAEPERDLEAADRDPAEGLLLLDSPPSDSSSKDSLEKESS